MDSYKYVTKLTDSDLISAARDASSDLLIASNREPNSEWHSACFAAAFIFSQEMSKRGLSINLYP